jgi:hypothetical protein
VRLFVPLALAVLLAGCAQTSPPPVAVQDQALPPGCAAERVAIAHHANGTPAAWDGPLPVGCLVHTGVDSSEPTLGVASDGTLFHYPAAVIDRDTPAANGVRFLTGVARSEDAGASWRVLLPTAGPVAPTHQASTDPYFYLDPRTDRIWADDLSAATCSVLSWSDDRGETWTNSLNGCAEFDHQTLFAGPPVASATVGYPDILYRCSINLVMLSGGSTTTTCTKSLDGGLTDSLTGAPPFVTDPADLPNVCDGAVGHGIVDDHGTLYLPKGRCPNPWLAVSKDEGNSWTRVQVAGNGMPGSWETGFEHDAGVGVDPAGNVYYAWIAADRMPYLAVSRDGGATWSAPIAVAPPGLREANLPALAVGGTGKLALAYFGSYDSPGAPWDRAAYGDTSWHQVITLSVDALADDPTFLTATANDPADPVARGECAIGRCNDAVKDFIHAVVGPEGTPWVSLVDGCLKACRAGQQTDIDGREGAVGRLWGGPSLLD